MFFLEDITVRFFKEDESDRLMWEAYGTFTPTDVHRQVILLQCNPPQCHILDNIQSIVYVIQVVM